MEIFLEKIKSLLGDDYENFLKCCQGENFRGLRSNPLKISFEELSGLLDFNLKKMPFCKNGAYLPQGVQSLGNHPLHHAGAFYIQEPSATSAVTLLEPQKGDKVLDLCAAPGGKSTQIAAELMGEGLLWSNEVVKSRANVLLSNIERMGVRNAVVSSCHPDILCDYLYECFDKVLVDAPCSGEGMFRKDPKALEQWSQEHVVSCAKRQMQILESAKKALKPGGTMVYSTCTFSREENEGVITEFLENNPDFELADPGVDFGRRTMKNAVRIFPMDGGEGHFTAKLRKSGDSYCCRQLPVENEVSLQEQKAIIDFLSDIVKDPRALGTFSVCGNRVYSFQGGVPAVGKIPVLRRGVLLGELKKGRIEPCHHMFTALKKDDFLRCIDFDYRDEYVGRFLHGEEIPVDISLKGYAAVCINGITCGFGKATGGKLKNKYPKGLRIL